MRLFLAALLGGAALILAVGASGSPTSFAAHPRIFLAPSTLSAVRQRAQQNPAAWQALKSQCDTYLTGTVEWPDGQDYPDGGSIGEGYQGSGYFAAIANLGLCYQVLRFSFAGLAAKYAAKGDDVLT